MNRRALLVRLGILGGAVAGGWWFKEHVLWPTPQPRFPGDGATGWIDFAARALTPTVRGRVGGVETVILIDSGAQYSVIDRGLWSRLEAQGRTGMTFPLPLLAYGVGGGSQVGRATSADVEAAGVTLEGLRLAILDLGPITDVEQGLGASVILGQDVLETLVLDVEVPAARLRLSAPGARPDPAGAEALLVRREGTSLRTTVHIEDRPVEALFDSGASAAVSLSRASAQRAGLLDGRPLRRGSSLVLGGAVGADVARADRIRVGARVLREVSVPIFGDVRAPGFPDALLGMAAFEGRTVRLDLGRPALMSSPAPDVRVGRRRR